MGLGKTMRELFRSNLDNHYQSEQICMDITAAYRAHRFANDQDPNLSLIDSQNDVRWRSEVADQQFFARKATLYWQQTILEQNDQIIFLLSQQYELLKTLNNNIMFIGRRLTPEETSMNPK